MSYYAEKIDPFIKEFSDPFHRGAIIMRTRTKGR